MKILKIFIIIIEMLIFAIGAIIIGCVMFPLLSVKYKDIERRKVFSKIIHKSWKFFIWLMDVTGIVKANYDMNLIKIQNKIIVASHPSLIDIVFLIGLIPNSICLAKKELLNNLFMRNIVKSLYIINDIAPDEFQKSSKQVLDEGYNIIIFPTGTRTLPDEKIKIHKGAAQLAIANNINIVPVKITVDFPFLAKHTSPFRVCDKKINYFFEVKPEIVIDDFMLVENNKTKLRHRVSDVIKERIN